MWNVDIGIWQITYSSFISAEWKISFLISNLFHMQIAGKSALFVFVLGYLF